MPLSQLEDIGVCMELEQLQLQFSVLDGRIERLTVELREPEGGQSLSQFNIAPLKCVHVQACHCQSM